MVEMNGFKNWLVVQEDAIDATIQQHFPNAPQWVQKDLFRDNWLKKFVKSSESKTPFQDWLASPQVQAFKNVQWPQKPECISVNPADFAEATISDFIVRRFGKKAITTRAFSAERDQAKTDTQCQIMANLHGSCEHVPVIMIRQPDNKLRMIEGWHRLMCRLVEGCPPDKAQYLTDESYQYWRLWDVLEPATWQKVKINAYVGVQGQPQTPRQAADAYKNLHGRTPVHDFSSPTGEWIPDGSSTQQPPG